MNLQFDTARIPARERAGFWREVVCSVYVPMNAEPLAHDAFHARMDVCAARGRVYSSVDAGAQRVSRDARQIARDERRDIYTFMLQRAGSCAVEQADARALLQPGDMLLFHNSRPYRLCFEQPFRQTVIQVPRDACGSLAIELDRRLARTVRAADPLGRLLHGFVDGLDGALPDADDGEAAVLLDELYHLLAAHGAASRAADAAPAQRTLVERAQRYASERLAEPELSIEHIAHAHHVSVRTLQRAFARQGAGVMQWLRDERLARCAAALADPALPVREIADIALAHGFRDVSAFGRSFKARYRTSPSRWRAARLPQ
jgi:AraC-like DNA-binding protein